MGSGWLPRCGPFIRGAERFVELVDFVSFANVVLVIRSRGRSRGKSCQAYVSTYVSAHTRGFYGRSRTPPDK
jgi:hypothetical protein